MTGRMRKDRQEILDLLRRDAVSRRLGQHVVERAAHGVAAALALDMAAPAHGRVLLGDGKKLEPDALGLQRPGHQLRREVGGLGAAVEHAGSISGWWRRTTSMRRSNRISAASFAEVPLISAAISSSVPVVGSVELLIHD